MDEQLVKEIINSESDDEEGEIKDFTDSYILHTSKPNLPRLHLVTPRIIVSPSPSQQSDLELSPSPSQQSDRKLSPNPSQQTATESIYTNEFSEISDCDYVDSDSLSSTTSFSGETNLGASTSSSVFSPKSPSVVNAPTTCCTNDQCTEIHNYTSSIKIGTGASKKNIRIRNARVKKNVLYTKVYQGGEKNVLRSVNSKNIISRCWPHFAKMLASNIKRKYKLKAEKEIISMHNELLKKVQKNSRHSPCGAISNFSQLKNNIPTSSSSSDELSSSDYVTDSDSDSDY